ncbi:MAG: hypothetical protein RL722_1091 [Pseudomonadota bacterium]|jgi:hypothetical protein
MIATRARSLSALTLLAAAAAFSLPAQAQHAGAHPFFGFGLTGGGEDLASFQFSNGTTSTVTTGGLLEFKGGVEMHLSGPLSARVSLGYHVDNTNASNGSFRFERFPLEGLVFWQGAPNFRLGGGLRQAMSPRASGTGVASGSATFSADLGGVVEGEYFFNPRTSLYGRAVFETYKVSGISLSGDHVGIGVNFYF